MPSYYTNIPNTLGIHYNFLRAKPKGTKKRYSEIVRTIGDIKTGTIWVELDIKGQRMFDFNKLDFKYIYKDKI